MKPCIIVHGGASNIAQVLVDGYKQGIQKSAKAGYNLLLQGGSAVDAVTAAVSALEDDHVFNAGCGSVLTEEGTVEMDSLIMDGRNLSIGAVGAITSIANPVQLSRKVMEDTPHCLLVGEGALKFARKIGHPVLDDPGELIVQESLLKMHLDSYVKDQDNNLTIFNNITGSKDLRELEEKARKIAMDEKMDPSNGSVAHDTVGAVAMDANGNIASATSTGGIPGKWIGRVGDTPLPGCGGYANKCGGAASTGHGESILKVNVCRQVVRHIENGDDAQTAADKAIQELGEETVGTGGVVCIDNKGNIGHAFSTYRMGWALITENGIQYGVDQGECLKASLQSS
eukprot:gene150-762_t